MAMACEENAQAARIEVERIWIGKPRKRMPGDDDVKF